MTTARMNVKKLFFQRLLAEWKYQYQVWKTAVDWIVALYIVIPFLAIFLYSYHIWWKAAPEWLDYVPLNVLWAFILLFAWSGTMRIFVEEADQLFLLQSKIWLTRLMRYGLVYSISYNLGAAALLLIILAPFLVLHYGFSLLNIVWILFYVFLLKNCLGILKQFLAFRFKGWNGRIAASIIFLIAGVYLRGSMAFLFNRQGPAFFMSMLGLLFLAGIFISQRLKLRGTFIEDVAREQTARLRLAKFMLQNAGTYVHKPRFTRKRPLTFRSSNLLYRQRSPVNGLVEVCIKGFLRNEKDVLFYLELVGLYFGLIWLLPAEYKWLLWIVFSVVMTNLVWLSWREVINEPFVSLFPWLSETKVAAARKALFLMVLPGQLVLGLEAAVQIGSWPSAMGMLSLGIVIAYFSAQRVSLRS